jgi:uncharacterized membrane protein
MPGWSATAVLAPIRPRHRVRTSNMPSRIRSSGRRLGRAVLSVALACAVVTLAVPGNASARASVPTDAASSDLPSVSLGLVGSGRDHASDRGHGFVRDARGYRTVDAPGASSTAALGRNNRGQVVGSYLDKRDRFHGFVQRGQHVEDIDVPGAQGTVASKINDDGQIVGYYTNRHATPSAQFEHGFLYDPHGRGRVQRIEVPDASATRPFGINNGGQIVGDYVDRAGVSHGFVRHPDGTVTRVDVPGATATQPSDIDDRGRIVGSYVDAATYAVRGFLREADGTITTIDAGPSSFTQLLGINNQGQIVGYALDGRFVARGFIREPDGSNTPVTFPGTKGATVASDIDDRGGLAGDYGLKRVSGYVGDRRGRIETFDVPGALTETRAEGVNDDGDIVGTFDPGVAGDLRGFRLDRRGRVTRIHVPGAGVTTANATNDHDQIVGAYSHTTEDLYTGQSSGYLLDGGRFTTITVPDAVATIPYGINNRGQIVGGYTGADGVTRGFVRDRHGRIDSFDVEGAVVTIPYDNNDRGQVVGVYLDTAGRQHGFLRSPRGHITTIDVPGMFATRLQGINNEGQIVIDSVDKQLLHHSWLLENGQFTEIKPRGVLSGSLASDINDQGRIVGWIL